MSQVATNSSMSEKLFEVLMKIYQAHKGFPPVLTRQLRVSQKASKTHGQQTRAHRVCIGKACLFFEYDKVIARGDTTPEDLRFLSNRSFDIPSLAHGSSVRYYIHKNIGCRSWDVFVRIIRGLEQNLGEYLPVEYEKYMRRRD